MPLPADEKVVETSKAILETFHDIFGPHPGYRPAHAKGILLKGTFTPTAKAAALSVAQHFNQPSTPVLARFSSSTGFPSLPDTDPNGNPRGLAVRFQLAESPRRVHTDIVAHSADGFPAPDGPSTLAFFRALRDGSIGDYLASHPAAAAFVQLPKPFPAAFATERFFGVTAFRLVDAQGRGTYIRYRIEPVAGVRHLGDDEVPGKSEAYLYDGVADSLAQGGPIRFKLTAQVAAEGDVTDDNTQHWPEDREVVELGELSLESIVEPTPGAEQKRLIFDPVPRVDGIEPSADPLLDVRAALYLLSGKERRAA